MSVLGFIGDSITFGYDLSGSAPPVLMCATLSTPSAHVTPSNQGLNGASTQDWAITGEGKPLTNAMTSFTRAGVTTVLIMLGTNDSKPWINTSPAQYQANLLFIINALKGIGVQKFVLNLPPAMQPSATGFPDPSPENAIIQSYLTNLQNLAAADAAHVFIGDQTAFAVFQAHPEYYQADGIHPNDTGAVALAQLWVVQYLNPKGVTQAMSNNPVITPGGGSTTPGAGTVTPLTISTSPSDAFVFPGDVTVDHYLHGGSGVTFKITPIADGTAALQITSADGSRIMLNVDTTNGRIGIGGASPANLLDVDGNMSIAGQLAMGPSRPGAVCLIDMQNPFVGLGIMYMTQAQRRAIGVVARRNGNTVYCTDTDGGDGPGMYYDDGAAWQKITATPAAS